jgi:signal transduction histidine kinase
MKGAAPGAAWPARILWLTGLAVAAVVAVNVAGLWGIAVARRSVAEEAARLFRAETSARARAIEAALAATRADLAFLAGSPAFAGLPAALASDDPREVRWRRLWAEGSLLLFLRGHPEVAHLALRPESGPPLMQAGRRGGVPVIWIAAAAGGGPGASRPAGAPEPSGSDRRRVGALFGPREGGAQGPGAVAVEAELDLADLLARGRSAEDPARRCSLLDAGGSALASEIPLRAAPPGPAPARAGAGGAPAGAGGARADVRTEGWTAPAPWTLSCGAGPGGGVPLLDPLTARYRAALVLNLTAMGLVLLLGSFALQQVRRRLTLEAKAAEEARVRELERQLFHAERLGTVGRLAAGIAHEINNPLEGMSNYLTLAREDLARGDAAAARRRLEGLREGLERAAGIVSRVLAHADPAAAPRSRLDLRAPLLQSLEFVRSRREFAGIEFVVDVAPDPVEVDGIAAMLGQVFLNLLLNACEAQPRGGEVRVAARLADGHAVVEIADRGPGVPREEAARIFEPFYSTKDSTGLGLSVCWSIVRRHEGEIAVEGRPGGGALFRLRLPAAGRAGA